MSIVTTHSDQKIADRVIPAPRRSLEGTGSALPDLPGRPSAWFRQHRVLLAVLTTALGVRVWGVTAHLPFVHHPDEPTNLRVIGTIVGGDPNPHFFNYPSLFLYL